MSVSVLKNKITSATRLLLFPIDRSGIKYATVVNKNVKYAIADACPSISMAHKYHENITMNIEYTSCLTEIFEPFLQIL